MFKGFFGSMFDLNRDGKLDAFERALEYQFIEEELMKDEEDEDEIEDEIEEENWDEDWDD